jgi:hypothetical protein
MYPSLLRNYETVGLYNFAVAHADLPDDFVYQVVRTVFENQDEMIEAHPAAAETVLPTSIGTHLFRSIQGPSVITDRADRMLACELLCRFGYMHRRHRLGEVSVTSPRRGELLNASPNCLLQPA